MSTSLGVSWRWTSPPCPRVVLPHAAQLHDIAPRHDTTRLVRTTSSARRTARWTTCRPTMDHTMDHTAPTRHQHGTNTTPTRHQHGTNTVPTRCRVVGFRTLVQTRPQLTYFTHTILPYGDTQGHRTGGTENTIVLLRFVMLNVCLC